MRSFLSALLCLGLAFASTATAADGDTPYLGALAKEGAPPQAYVLRQFEHADLVLLGEDHAVAQNLAFVRDLIPRLHRAGIHNLVMEFGAQEDQRELDRLLTAPEYDEAALRRLMFHYNSAWSWKEYLGLYRAAWELNRRLPAGSAPFRIVNMSYVYRWDQFRAPRTPESLQRIFWRGTVDRFRADLIDAEVLAKGGKALVLTGTPHAFTRYAMPAVAANNEGFCAYDDQWLGNRLLRRAPGRVVSVLLHQPFPNRADRRPAYVQPAGGAVERLMAERGNAPVGFDLRGSVLGALPDDSFYATCRSDFRLADLFDGYVFLAPFRQLRPATADPTFVDESNLAEALRQFPDPDWAPPPRDLAGFRAHLLHMAQEIHDRYQAVP